MGSQYRRYQNQTATVPPKTFKQIAQQLPLYLIWFTPIEWLGVWISYLFKSAGIRLFAELIALGVILVTFWGFWHEYQQRGVDRGVRIATLFAQIAQVQALPDHGGASALKSSLEALAQEKIPMKGLNLSHANLNNAQLDGVILESANLSEAKLINISLFKAELSMAKLQNAQLREADLRGADLSSANLKEANLTWANLSGANLSIQRNSEITVIARSSLIDSLDFSELPSKKFNHTQPDFINKKTIILDSAPLNKMQIQLLHAYLILATISGANLEGAKLIGTNLTGTDLTGANLNRANLLTANFSKAILSRVNFKDARNIPDLSNSYADPEHPPINIPEGVPIPDKWQLPPDS